MHRGADSVAYRHANHVSDSRTHVRAYHAATYRSPFRVTYPRSNRHPVVFAHACTNRTNGCTDGCSHYVA